MEQVEHQGFLHETLSTKCYFMEQVVQGPDLGVWRP